MHKKQNSINLDIAVFLDKIKTIAENLLEQKFENVLLSIARPPTGSIGCHNLHYLCDVNNNKKYSFIHLHPALFQFEHKATFFGTIIHEFIHELLKDEFFLVDKKYEPHGASFKKEFEKLGVNVDSNGLIENIDTTGKFFLSYKQHFKELTLPLLYNLEPFKIEEEISIQGTAKCPNCDLEVITLNSKGLICKECHAELDNDYLKLLTDELNRREELYKQYLYDFEYLCVYYPLETSKEIAYVKEALELSDKNRLEELQYSGVLDNNAKNKLYQAAYNLIISHTNIAKIKELKNV